MLYFGKNSKTSEWEAVPEESKDLLESYNEITEKWWDEILEQKESSINAYIAGDENGWPRVFGYPKSQEELNRLNEIAVLKQKLADTDYIVTKAMEAQIFGIKFELNDYSDIILQRQIWRARINELEESQNGK